MDRLQAYWTTRRYLSSRPSGGTVQDVCRREAARLIHDDPRITSYNVCYTKLLREGKIRYGTTKKMTATK